MYRMIILLVLGVFATTSVEAKKVRILAAAPSPTPMPVLSMTRDAVGNCVYNVTSGHYDLFAHVHRNTIASVVAIAESGEATLESRTYTSGFTIQIAWTPPAPFVIAGGEAWSLALVLESANGKGRLIDAMEFLSGNCPPP